MTKAPHNCLRGSHQAFTRFKDQNEIKLEFKYNVIIFYDCLVAV